MDERRQKALQYARSLLGVKWRHRGRKPWAVDCVGLVLLSLHAAGLELEDEKHYGREPWKDKLRQKLRARFGPPIREEQWQPGDIALFKWGGYEPSHIGLLADYKYSGFALIHSRRAKVQNCVVEHALDERWRRLLVEVYSPWET